MEAVASAPRSATSSTTSDEDIDARLQRVTLEVPFGAVTDTEEGQ